MSGLLYRVCRAVGLVLLLAVLVAGCAFAPERPDGRQPHRNYALSANLELYADSALLEQLPLKDAGVPLYKGDRVVVVEFAVHPDDEVDSLWVKVAHTQTVQGWIRERDLKASFVPTGSVSQFIYLFSRTHVPYFLAICACFVVFTLIRLCRKKVIRLVWFNDIDSFYPMLLCVLLALSAVLYESMQLFAADMWEQYYFQPSLSPFQVPALLGVFLACIWLSLAVSLALLSDVFRQLDPLTALFYLSGLLAVCVILYFFFILTTRFYVGYFFLMLLLGVFVRRLRRMSRYRCGACGAPLKAKGVCPKCRTLNE